MRCRERATTDGTWEIETTVNGIGLERDLDAIGDSEHAIQSTSEGRAGPIRWNSHLDPRFWEPDRTRRSSELSPPENKRPKGPCFS